MPEFVTVLLAWLLAGSLVWLAHQTTGRLARCAYRVNDADDAIGVASVSLVIIVSWPAFAPTAVRDLVRGIREGWL
jgi:hypothetical protein